MVQGRLRAWSEGKANGVSVATADDRQPPLIVFADDWGRHPSSCQHLVRRLAARRRILWVNSIGTRKVRADGFTIRRGVEKIRNWARGLRQVSEQMWVLDPPMLPAGGSRIGRRLNRTLVTRRVREVARRLRFHRPLVLTTLPYTSWLLGEIGQQALIYYCTDDYSYWPSADREMLQAAEREIGRQANLVLAVSKKLETLYRGATRCEYFPHAVDYEHFASSASISSLPKRLEEFPRPRIGFFGLIYEKLDFALLTAIAVELPEANLIMIGPVDHCPSGFAARANVHLVGKQPYEALPSWIAGLDVLLMPYAHDEMIWQSNPLKLRECLATGKPTVSVDIPEVRTFAPHVRVAQTKETFIAAVREAIDCPEPPSIAAARRAAIKRETWDFRAAQLEEYIASLATEQ